MSTENNTPATTMAEARDVLAKRFDARVESAAERVAHKRAWQAAESLDVSFSDLWDAERSRMIERAKAEIVGVFIADACKVQAGAIEDFISNLLSDAE